MLLEWLTLEYLFLNWLQVASKMTICKSRSDSARSMLPMTAEWWYHKYPGRECEATLMKAMLPNSRGAVADFALFGLILTIFSCEISCWHLCHWLIMMMLIHYSAVLHRSQSHRYSNARAFFEKWFGMVAQLHYATAYYAQWLHQCLHASTSIYK